MERNSNGNAVELSDSWNPESPPADFRPTGHRGATTAESDSKDRSSDGYDGEACQGVRERLATTEATSTSTFSDPCGGLVLESWPNPAFRDPSRDDFRRAYDIFKKVLLLQMAPRHIGQDVNRRNFPKQPAGRFGRYQMHRGLRSHQ